MNHAAKLHILSYTGANASFFTGLHVQPSTRVGSTVLSGPLQQDLASQIATCTVLSDATLSVSYDGVCSAHGFQQTIVQATGLAGTELSYIAAGQSTQYTSIEDCCSVC